MSRLAEQDYLQMRLRVLADVRGFWRRDLKISCPHMTGKNLHEACLSALDTVAQFNRYTYAFPVGVGSDLVDTTRYWVCASSMSMASYLWERGLWVHLTSDAKEYFHVANQIQQDALKSLAKEIGSF